VNRHRRALAKTRKKENFMIQKIKKLALMLALAGTVGTSLTPAMSTANAMPRGPVAESGAAAELVRHRGVRHRRWHRGRRWNRGHRRHRRNRWHRRHRSWGGRPWAYRRCYRYLRRYRITGRRYWLYRYRRCIRWRHW